MPSDPIDQDSARPVPGDGAGPALSEARRRARLPKIAQDALAEADARRAEKARGATDANRRKPEKGGPKGAEPTRFGDWERNGRAVDF
ncbi:MAG: succinate dehydrogenase assembly factor 4 [Pseudomonadota bacterium]